MRIALHVKEQNISEGERWKKDTCPIALALADKGFDSVAVSAYTASFYGQEFAWKYSALLSRRAVQFVKNFDKTGTATPATFILNTSIHDYGSKYKKTL